MQTLQSSLYYALSCLILISSVSVSQADADLLFQIVNHAADQNGHALNGLITTTDAAINDGILIQSEVISWEFEIAGPTNTFIQSSDVGANFQITGDVLITANEITLEQPPIMSGFLNLIEFGHSDGSRVIWHRDEFFGANTDIFQGFSQNNSSWVNNAPAMSGTDPWLVATRISAVPEPAGSCAIVAVIGLRLIRRRRTK